MIAQIIGLEFIWMVLLILVGIVLHSWSEISGARKVVVYSTSAITAAIICSYPFLM